MYKPVRQLVIDSSNKCSLQCPKCGREGFRISKQKVPGELLTVEKFEKLIDYFDEMVEFCGQISDPVMNPNLPKFLSILHEKKIPSIVSTAASYRSLDWYKNIYKLNPNTKWVFGLDGLPEESHIYRKNQDGPKIFEAMKLASSMNVKVVWQYIVFRYNENHIEQAIEMAKENGIIFELNISSRWNTSRLKPDVIDDELAPLNPKYIKKHGTEQSELFS